MQKVTVTGATGHLGRRVLNDIIKANGKESVKAAVHSAAKAQTLEAQGIAAFAVDYMNEPSMVKAFAGSDVVVYIPSATYDVLQRVTEFENTLKALKQAEVANVVFVSFFADQETNPFRMSPYYGYAPRRLAGSGLNFAVLKNSLYADPLVPYLPELIQRQHLIYPIGDEALSFIAQDDSAAAIAAVALHPQLRDRKQIYTLTQSQNYRMPELGRLMTEATGKPIGYAPVSNEKFAQIYAQEGDGSELASMYAGGAMGLMNAVTTDFETITGRKPQDMETFLKCGYQKLESGEFN